MKLPDKITKEQRSYIMSQIRGTRTKPELIVKESIDSRKLRYQPKGIPERPDFANKTKRIAVFIDGCFWHGCPEHYQAPARNAKFWLAKRERNRERDVETDAALAAAGWRTLRFWEHEVRTDPDAVARAIAGAARVAPGGRSAGISPESLGTPRTRLRIPGDRDG